MKTLKVTLLLFAILIANTAFSQTKEETIEWLNNNGPTLLNSKGVWSTIENWDVEYSFYKAQNDTLVFRNRLFVKSQFKQDDFIFIPSNSIEYQDVSTLKFMPDTDYFFKIPIILLKGTKVKELYSDGSYSNREQSYYNILLSKNGNEENAKRVLKAIMHLAKLSGAKENKQTF